MSGNNPYTSSWKARIIPVIREDGRDPYPVKPYNSLNITFNRNISIIDSVDDGNVGYIFGNRRYSFSIEVFPVAKFSSSGIGTIGDNPLVRLNNIFLNSRVFDIILTSEERDLSITAEDGKRSSTWAYDNEPGEVVTLRDCLFTSGGIGSYDTTASLKIIRFDGLALGISFNNSEIYR
jgi:hypothetical protein